MRYSLKIPKPLTVSWTVSVDATPGGRSVPKKSEADPWKRTPEQCVADWLGCRLPKPVAVVSVSSSVRVRKRPQRHENPPPPFRIVKLADRRRRPGPVAEPARDRASRCSVAKNHFQLVMACGA